MDPECTGRRDRPAGERQAPAGVPSGLLAWAPALPPEPAAWQCGPASACLPTAPSPPRLHGRGWERWGVRWRQVGLGGQGLPRGRWLPLFPSLAPARPPAALGASSLPWWTGPVCQGPLGAPSPRGGCSGPRQVGQAARAMASLSGATVNAPPFAPSVREQRRGHQLVWREEEEPLADTLRPGPGRRATLPSAASSHSVRSPCGPAVQGLRPPRAPARERMLGCDGANAGGRQKDLGVSSRPSAHPALQGWTMLGSGQQRCAWGTQRAAGCGPPTAGGMQRGAQAQCCRDRETGQACPPPAPSLRATCCSRGVLTERTGPAHTFPCRCPQHY